jgi:hypothetical protein
MGKRLYFVKLYLGLREKMHELKVKVSAGADNAVSAA